MCEARDEEEDNVKASEATVDLFADDGEVRASTGSLLNDLGTDLQLELYKIEPEVSKQSANDIMYGSFQQKQKRGRVPSPSPGAGPDARRVAAPPTTF